MGGCANEKRNSPAAGVPKGVGLAASLVTGCQYPWYGLLASRSGHLLVAQAEGTGQVSDRSRGHSLTDRRRRSGGRRGARLESDFCSVPPLARSPPSRCLSRQRARSLQSALAQSGLGLKDARILHIMTFYRALCSIINYYVME